MSKGRLRVVAVERGQPPRVVRDQGHVVGGGLERAGRAGQQGALGDADPGAVPVDPEEEAVELPVRGRRATCGTRRGRGAAWRRGYVGAGDAQPTVPTYDDIRRAGELVAPWVRRTPVMEVDVHGRPVALKLELLQHAGSFKVRGAFTSVLSAPEPPTALVAASGGNHGLAVAYVGHALGIPTRIFVPQTAPAVKVRRSPRSGPRSTRSARRTPRRWRPAWRPLRGPGVLALHAYDSWATVAGQGTLGLEIAEQVPGAGHACWSRSAAADWSPGWRTRSPGDGRCRWSRVEPAACPTLHRALERGGRSAWRSAGVAADALGASRLGEHRLRDGDASRASVRCWSATSDRRRPSVAVAPRSASRPSRPVRRPSPRC